MLLELEKVYAIINVYNVENEYTHMIKKQIPVTDIRHWMTSTRHKTQQRWRVHDYLIKNDAEYRDLQEQLYDDDDDVAIVDYVYKVHDNRRIKKLIARVNCCEITYVVLTNKDNIIATTYVRLNSMRNPLRIYEDVVGTHIRQHFLDVLGIYGKKPEKNETFDSLLTRWEERHGETPGFSYSYIEQSWEGMVNAFVVEIVHRLIFEDKCRDFNYDSIVDDIFSELYFCDGQDMSQWEYYAEQNELDPEDDDERQRYEEECDEFAGAWYKIDRSCINDVKTYVHEIIDEFLLNYDF